MDPSRNRRCCIGGQLKSYQRVKPTSAFFLLQRFFFPFDVVSDRFAWLCEQLGKFQQLLSRLKVFDWCCAQVLHLAHAHHAQLQYKRRLLLA